ncbi:TPA: SUMF1/EgtB/PvdO family nonheme iron enzyme [Listeria innocua]|nr:SUMF1/EgtB/PvdO family nonheme iron enzyme [Listeria innocua]
MKIYKLTLDNLLYELRDSEQKKFGYLLSSNGKIIDDYYIFSSDDRQKEDVKEKFENIGKYYQYNKNAGFLATINETFLFEKYCSDNSLVKLAVFHVHLRHPNIFTKADWDLHPTENLKHLIVSLRNKFYPKYELFDINKSELEVICESQDILNKMIKKSAKFCKIYLNNKQNRFLFAEFLSQLTFNEQQVFWNEKGYKKSSALKQNNLYNKDNIKKTLVTNAEYKLLFEDHPLDDNYPVVNITYYDAYIFSSWAGGRLLKVEEWEENSDCIEISNTFEHHHKKMMDRVCYSENSNGLINQVALLEENKYGLFDMQGNVWEWCLEKDNVVFTKGGSFRAFPEMCRNNVNVIEKKHAFYDDLGFRYKILREVL